MGNKLKIYTETDHIGEHKVIEHKNGVKVRILKKQSSEYAKKLKKYKEKEIQNEKDRLEKENKEKIITDKMREIAIAELKKEGKL